MSRCITGHTQGLQIIVPSSRGLQIIDAIASIICKDAGMDELAFAVIGPYGSGFGGTGREDGGWWGVCPWQAVSGC
jgi:hypothetical protein